MDPSAARMKLDNLVGYVHPTETKGNRGNIYKTFSETDNTSNSSINNFKNTVVGKNYASMGVTDAQQDKCPICKADISFSCPCVFSDKTCKNGHTWYYDREDGKIRKGKPH
jgi:hypothetical protein